MQTHWLPPEFAAAPFGVADARASGMPLWRLRNGVLHSPTRSVRSVDAPRTPVQRAAAFWVALPDDAVFSHVTAGQLWKLSLPNDLEGQRDLDVMRATSRAHVRRSECIGHRGLELRATTTAAGLRVTGLADTWVDLGEVLDRGITLDDLVVMGDEVATRLCGRPEPGNAHQGLSDLGREQLRATLARRVRPRGKSILVEALGLVRAPVRSPMETRARLMFHRAGFPEPQVNRPVFHRDGSWLLEGDLVWESERVVGEYQGRDHASIRRRSYDASRNALAADEAWRVLEIYAEDVYRPARRVDCLTRFARALHLDPARLVIR
ncbi:hypothetical protein [Pedococcus bigeumensis]|uniref:DUF559 domain-containing protein n=1 Tax=Pedococcus bigeumensis TaxID=433644 RepID=A0A502D3R8_9MICO|nr:hypothetical protein [Pedococcus bigeumensis]TPG19039.1 hypothetical protein EAH86_00475 [Pedococcus bigeumensis]